MNKRQRKRIIDRHSNSLKRFGYHPHALYWSSREIQEIRFKVLAEIGVSAGDTILDVGCGFADLKSWFTQQGLDVLYTGIDISPHLIEVAKEKNPDVCLYVGELSDCGFKAKTFDWVLLSGALNEPYHDKGKYAKKCIVEMFDISSKGIAFNLLNAAVVKAYDLQSFDADETFEFCKKITSNVQLITGYLTNDFTIYMRKNN